MPVSDWISDVLQSDLEPGAKAVAYALVPYLVAYPGLRRLVINGGENVHSLDAEN